MNGASALMQYFVLPLNGSKYYLKYTFKAIHVLAILDPSAPLIVSIQNVRKYCIYCKTTYFPFWRSIKDSCYKLHFSLKPYNRSEIVGAEGDTFAKDLLSNPQLPNFALRGGMQPTKRCGA